MKKILSIIFLFVYIFSFQGAPFAYADSDHGFVCPAGKICYTPLEPGVIGPSSGAFVDDFPLLVKNVFKLVLGLAALFAVGSFVFGGISYMVSEIADRKEAAKKRIQSAMWGLLLLLASYLILYTINPDLLKLQLSGTDAVFKAGAPTSVSAANDFIKNNTCLDDPMYICPNGGTKANSSTSAAQKVCITPVGQGGFEGTDQAGQCAFSGQHYDPNTKTMVFIENNVKKTYNACINIRGGAFQDGSCYYNGK